MAGRACLHPSESADQFHSIFLRIDCRVVDTLREAVVGALNDAVRYLIAGGLAVNAHGYLRFTHDVDLVVQLLPDNVESAFQALESIGYGPTVPVVLEESEREDE